MSLATFPTHLVRAVGTTLVAALILAPATFTVLASSEGSTVGALSVTSDPANADVYVDGKLSGRTPLTMNAVPAGDHRVRIVKAGYLENSRVVGVGPSRTNTVTVRLTRHDETPRRSSSAVAPGGSSKKWLWIGLGVAAAGAAALSLGGKDSPAAPINAAPTISGVTASASVGLASATSISFAAAGASDPEGATLTYSWDFGNGTTSTSPTPSTVFATAGTYTVSVTVSDGQKTASASTSVTIRSMTGIWRGSSSTSPLNGVTFILTQTLGNISGSYSDSFGAGTANGSVKGTTFRVTLAISQPQTSYFVTFEGDPDANINVITGRHVGAVTTHNFVLTRQ